jgi:tRNA-2-methylthio-N6-dimethylallyladenosine synthase
MKKFEYSDKKIDESLQGSPLNFAQKPGNNKKVFIESYGCQMNMNDSEIVASILSKQGYNTTSNLEEADLILLNTCSIREKAETTVRNRLKHFNKLKQERPKTKIGLMGCMAERIKEKILDEEKLVDLVVGPDAYRDLPNLINELEDGRKAVNVLLSKEETYGDIEPVRLNSNGVSAFVSITRGCDNMCTFCVVPFTRGRERSRDPESILKEIQSLHDNNFKEVTLLGQNVDSYLWYGGGLKKDFDKQPDNVKEKAVNFAKLLDLVATEFPDIRIRFSTSNPQDFSLEVIKTMAKHPNIAKHIHLPVQSGSDRILELMNRKHTVAQYKETIDAIRKHIPDVAISQDMIAGFCTETEEDHQATLDLMDYVKYDFGFMFAYSVRPGTLGAKKLPDDVPHHTKLRRLREIIDKQQAHSLYRMQQFVGKEVEVLIEGNSKKSDQHWMGRNSQNAVVIFEKTGQEKPGDLVQVKVNDCTSATLFGNRI